METSYENILCTRLEKSDFAWVTKEYKPPRRQFINFNESEDILNSAPVTAVIEQLSGGDVERMRKLKKNGEEILKELCHTKQLHWVRWTGLVLSKLLRRLYNAVYVNPEGIENLRNISGSTPVVLLPTHRSYADFLVISYIMFHYNLPLPAIAAGMDFKGMAGVGELLRNCGAFFIRRSFGTDKLYWTIVSEYMKSQLIENGTLEFFIEGTRSRSGTFLSPKFGLVSVITEAFSAGRVFDAAFVPVSVSYDRVLEETLFARETEGTMKPQESTSGLLKALSTLKENYGNIFITIGNPIYSSQHIPRLPGNPAGNRETAERLAETCINALVDLTPVPLFSLVSVQFTTSMVSQASYIQLLHTVNELSDLVVGQHSRITQKPSLSTLKDCLTVHKNLVRVCNGTVSIKEPDQGESTTLNLQMLQIYTNQALHRLAAPATAVLSVLLASADEDDIIEEDMNPVLDQSSLVEQYYSALRLVLTPEMPALPVNFRDGIQQYQTKPLWTEQQRGTCSVNRSTVTILLIRLLYPVLKVYSCIVHVLLSQKCNTECDVIQTVRNLGDKYWYRHYFRNLSSQSNFLKKLKKDNVIVFDKGCRVKNGAVLEETCNFLNKCLATMKNFDCDIQSGCLQQTVLCHSKL